VIDSQPSFSNNKKDSIHLGTTPGISMKLYTNQTNESSATLVQQATDDAILTLDNLAVNIASAHFEESSPVVDSFVERQNNSTFGTRFPLKSEIGRKVQKYMRKAKDESFGCVDLKNTSEMIRGAFAQTAVLNDVTNRMRLN
jgi:hypothetical protein